MPINIDTFSEAELVDLNHRIVERLRFLRHARTHSAMLEFRIGQRVWFDDHGMQVFGTLTKYNRKTVTVITDDGSRWNISPQLLHAESSDASPRQVVLPKQLPSD